MFKKCCSIVSLNLHLQSSVTSSHTVTSSSSCWELWFRYLTVCSCVFWSRGAGQEPFPVRAGVHPVSGQPKLPELWVTAVRHNVLCVKWKHPDFLCAFVSSFGSERRPEGATLHQLPEVPAVLERAWVRQVPQVSYYSIKQLSLLLACALSTFLANNLKGLNTQ